MALATMSIGWCDEPNAAELEAAVIAEAFAATCEGYSSDELLIQNRLRDNFLRFLATNASVEIARETERAALLRLLQLRKAGKLTNRATERGKRVSPEVQVIAEIAARVITDRHRITTDTMLADPEYRRELQSEAELIAPEVDAYSVRKSVLALRKKRSLRPELVLQVADWSRRVVTYSLDELKQQIDSGQLTKLPGIYLFRNPEGYLYIGEAADLAVRLSDHVSGSDRQSLADYLTSEQSDQVTVELHIFPADSPAKKVGMRRAYESELIRSRHPKFNVRP